MVEQQKRLGDKQPNLGDSHKASSTPSPLNNSGGVSNTSSSPSTPTRPLSGSVTPSGAKTHEESTILVLLTVRSNNTNNQTKSTSAKIGKLEVKQNTEQKRKAVLEKLQADMKAEGAKTNLSVVVIGVVLNLCEIQG